VRTLRSTMKMLTFGTFLEHAEALFEREMGRDELLALMPPLLESHIFWLDDDQEFQAGARENMAARLEAGGHSLAAAIVRAMTVDGFGDRELDLWPVEETGHGGGGCPGGLAISLSRIGQGKVIATAGSGRTLHDTTHQYPGLEEYRKSPTTTFPKGKCKNGCGAEMAPMGCCAPEGVDPFGDCPAVTKK
jgi:hypothetical protein